VTRIGRSLVTAASLVAFSISCAKADETTIQVGAAHKLQAELIRPDGPGPYPAILVLHTSGGLQSYDTAFAQSLAQQGYVALVPAFMAAYGITPRSRFDSFTSDAEPIYQDLVAALETLSQNDKVKGSKLGAVGFSNGGYFAAWLAATHKVDAAIGYYGAYSGAGTDKSLSRFRPLFTKTSAPLLILHGGSDGTVPVQVAQNLAAIATAAQAPVELQIYQSADHRFDREPGSPAAEAAAKDAWTRTLDFFAKNLKPR
jgi:carboxymethylenebutenolidase